jgi:hypothetical protein
LSLPEQAAGILPARDEPGNLGTDCLEFFNSRIDNQIDNTLNVAIVRFIPLHASFSEKNFEVPNKITDGAFPIHHDTSYKPYF